MATRFASKVFWRMCPVDKSPNPAKMLKRNLKYSHKITKNSSRSEMKTTPIRNIHQITDQYGANKITDELIQQMMHNEQLINFKEGTRYELCDSTKGQSDESYNVVGYFSNVEKGRYFAFPHLQPANQRPFGAMPLNYNSETTRIRPVSIIYPPEETKQQQSNIVHGVNSTGKLTDVNKKNYTTSARNSYPASKTKDTTDVPVASPNYSKIAEILQRTYHSNRVDVVKTTGKETVKEKNSKLASKSKSKARFSINSPRNTITSRQNVLTSRKPDKNPIETLILKAVKNYNTSAGDKNQIEYIKLCTKETEKKLPKLTASACPPFTSSPTITNVNLKRLKKQIIPEKQNHPCGPIKICPPRADDNLQFKQKKLPIVAISTCPGVEPTPLKDTPPIKRLKKTPIKQPPPPCPSTEICPTRADLGLQIPKKQLPSLPVSQCLTVEPPPLKDTKPLKKLPKSEIKEPERVKVCLEEVCPPRADTGLSIESKKLPELQAKECPIVEPEPMKEAAPLKRLEKTEVLPPERICIEEECPRREPEIVEAKRLPKIEFNDCPPVEMSTTQTAPALKRLEKVDIPEPKKECIKESCEQNVRADRDCWAFLKNTNTTSTENEPCGKRNYSTCVINTNELALSKVPHLNPIDNVSFVVHKTNSRPIGSVKISNKIGELSDKFRSSYKKEIHEDVCFRGKCEEGESKGEQKSPTPSACQPKNRSNDCSDTAHTEFKYKSDHDCALKYVGPPDCELKPKSPSDCKEQSKCKSTPDCETKPKSDCKEQSKCKSTPKSDCKVQCKPTQQCGSESSTEEPSMWLKIVNYFKARPDCPTPEEFRMQRLKEKAEKAAEQAGLRLYDPTKNEICCKK